MGKLIVAVLWIVGAAIYAWRPHWLTHPPDWLVILGPPVALFAGPAVHALRSGVVHVWPSRLIFFSSTGGAKFDAALDRALDRLHIETLVARAFDQALQHACNGSRPDPVPPAGAWDHPDKAVPAAPVVDATANHASAAGVADVPEAPPHAADDPNTPD